MSDLTDRDVRRQVLAALDGQDAEYDVESIVRDLIDRHGLAEQYDDEDFWSVVAEHERPEQVEPRVAFEEDLGAQMRATPGPVQWTDERTTVTVAGGGWKRLSWPQPWGVHVTIATPDGVERTIDGEAIGSWDELWALVRDAGEEWDDETERLLTQARGAQDALDRAQRAVDKARRRRDVLIGQASAAGVTAYRIAQRLGISQPTVGRVLR